MTAMRAITEEDRATESMRRVVLLPLLHAKFGGSMMSVMVAFAANKTRSLVADGKSEPNNGKSDKSFLYLGQASVLVLSDLIGVAGSANIKVFRANRGGMNVAGVKVGSASMKVFRANRGGMNATRVKLPGYKS